MKNSVDFPNLIGIIEIYWGGVGSLIKSWVRRNGQWQGEKTMGVSMSKKELNSARGRTWARKIVLAGLAALSMPVFAMSAMANPSIVNGDFATPNYVGTNPGWAYLFGPTGGWDFVSNAITTGNSGISSNVNVWFTGTPPVGQQAAFLQSGGIISQTVTGLTPGQNYQISLYAAQRSGYSSDPFSVNGIVDGNVTQLLYVNPAQTAFVAYSTAVFYSPSSTLNLSLNGVRFVCVPYYPSCDTDSAINDVVITPVSTSVQSSLQVDEPSSSELLILPLGVLLAAVGRRRNRADAASLAS